MAVPRNEREFQILQEFRDCVTELKVDDGVLMRFLRASKLDKSRAAKMIEKFIQWQENAPCNIRCGWTLPPRIQLDVYLTGFDHEDRPVLWAPHGTWQSVRDLLDAGFKDDVIKLAGERMENVYKLLLRTKHQQMIVIVDNEGITLSKLFYEARSIYGFSLLMGLIQDFEQNFPEVLFKAIMCNNPAAFMWMWKILYPCFDDYTKTKIKLFGTSARDTDNFEEVLHATLPEDAIPPKYGGYGTLIDANEDLLEYYETCCIKSSAENV